MSTDYIRYRVPVEQAAAFTAAYERAATALRAAPECVDYELSRCEEDLDCWILRITWTSTSAHLAEFRQGPLFADFFAAIQPYVPNIEEMRHYTPTPVRGAGGAIPTLYDWAGGAPALTALFTAFYRAVVEDELLEPLFREMDPQHPAHVAAWLGEVFGGPESYSAQRGGHAGMVGHHLGKGITEQQRRRWVNLLIDAADEVGLPADPEFRAVFVGYLEWGSRMAMMYAAPGAGPSAAATPMPRWGWGVTPPYRPTR